MATEIERKFLVTSDEWRDYPGEEIRQGYLSRVPERTVRARIKGTKAYLTIKGKSAGAVRSEYEYEIPVDDAAAILDELCEKPLIEKRRHRIAIDGLVWEVDEFFGANAGLVLAEIELDGPDQEFSHPQWLGAEVTDDPRYYNANLSRKPFMEWQ